MSLDFSSALNAFHSYSGRYFLALFLPLPPLLPFVTNAVPYAAMAGSSNFSGLHLFMRVRALWMLLGYALVFPLE